jgi:hypothetical protein
MASTSQLISGTGVVLNFVTLLNEELVKAGGSPSMLYLSQLERGRPLVALLAKTIVESKLWRITKSEIVAEVIAGQDDHHYLEYDKQWSWSDYSKIVAKLTTIRFHSESEVRGMTLSEGDIIGVPPELVKQIEDYEGQGPCVVTWKGKPYIVTNWDATCHHYLKLAPAEYFDLEN